MPRHLLLLLALLGPALAHSQAEHSLALLQQENQEGIVPRYLLQDPYGRPVSNEDFRGRYQLISFGYTYCPDICPTTLVDMATILQQLGAQAEQVKALFITVDPERDTGKILKTYTEFFDPRILGLTGSPALIRRATEHFRVRFSKVIDPSHPDKPYAVDHSAGMILLGPEGRVLRKFPFGTPPAEIAQHISALISLR